MKAMWGKSKMLVGIRHFYSVIFTLGLTCACAAWGSPIELRTFKTHSRLLIRLDDSVQSDWKQTPGGFEILFKGIGMSELGAPIGVEGEWAKTYEALHDARLGGLQFKETMEGLVVSGKWQFPKGSDAPAKPEMEKFDYRDRKEIAYVMDFWVKPGPTVAQMRAYNLKQAKLEKQRKILEDQTQRRERRLASEKARTDLNDVTPFCKKPLDESRDVFLGFHHFPEKFDLNRWFSLSIPDRNYTYLEPKGEGKESNYVRLALNLYHQGNIGLVLRTLDFLDTEFPKNQYEDEMKFLRANAMIKLGLVEPASKILANIVSTAPERPVALHSALYLVNQAMEKRQYLTALENFMWLANKYPSHNLNWVFHLGIAECLFSLKQTERAAKEYEWIIANSKEKLAQVEAAIRIGNLYLSRAQYEQALASYFQALDKYKVEVKDYPSFFLNRAETLYNLRQFDQAEKEFEAYLNNYPSHPGGWRAQYRLGEIDGRREGDKARESSRQHFLNTINRFPFSPGAVLARLRLIPCGDHGGYDFESARRFFATEASAFDGGDQVMMQKYRDYRGLAEVRTWIDMGKDEMAVDAGIREVEANQHSFAGAIMGETLRGLFRKAILTKLAEGKKEEAISFYQLKGPRIPKHKEGTLDMVDPDYLLRLSQVASELGLESMVTTLNASYEVAKKAIEASGRKLATDDLDAKLNHSEENFTEAKNLWLLQGAMASDRIQEKLAHVTEESEYSYEREIILSLLNHKKGNDKAALGHALKAQTLVPHSTDLSVMAADRQRLDHWIATLQRKTNDLTTALEVFKKLQKDERSTAVGSRGDAAKVLGVPDVGSSDQLSIQEGEILALLGKWGESAEAYSRVVENGKPDNQTLYEYSRALSRTGLAEDKKKALSALDKLSDSPINDFWKKLATQSVEEITGKRKPAKEGGK